MHVGFAHLEEAFQGLVLFGQSGELYFGLFNVCSKRSDVWDGLFDSLDLS